MRATAVVALLSGLIAHGAWSSPKDQRVLHNGDPSAVRFAAASSGPELFRSNRSASEAALLSSAEVASKRAFEERFGVSVPASIWAQSTSLDDELAGGFLQKPMPSHFKNWDPETKTGCGPERNRSSCHAPVKYEAMHPVFGRVTIIDPHHVLPADTARRLGSKYAESLDDGSVGESMDSVDNDDKDSSIAPEHAAVMNRLVQRVHAAGDRAHAVLLREGMRREPSFDARKAARDGRVLHTLDDKNEDIETLSGQKAFDAVLAGKSPSPAPAPAPIVSSTSYEVARRERRKVINFRQIMRSSQALAYQGKYGEQDCARRCASVYGCKYFAIGKGKDNVGSCYTSNRLDSNAVPQTVGSQDQYSATSQHDGTGAIYQCPSGMQYQVSCSGGVPKGSNGSPSSSCKAGIIDSSCNGYQVTCGTGAYDMYEITEGYVEVRRNVFPRFLAGTTAKYATSASECKAFCKQAGSTQFLFRDLQVSAPTSLLETASGDAAESETASNNCFVIPKSACVDQKCSNQVFVAQAGMSLFALSVWEDTTFLSCKSLCARDESCEGFSFFDPYYFASVTRLQSTTPIDETPPDNKVPTDAEARHPVGERDPSLAERNGQPQAGELATSEDIEATGGQAAFEAVLAGKLPMPDFKTSQVHGVVEYQYDGVWGTVQSVNGAQDALNAAVACRMLGGTSAGANYVAGNSAVNADPNTWTASTAALLETAGIELGNEQAAFHAVLSEKKPAPTKNPTKSPTKSPTKAPTPSSKQIDYGSHLKIEDVNESTKRQDKVPGLTYSNNRDFRVHVVTSLACTGNEKSFAECRGVSFGETPFGSSEWGRGQLSATCSFDSALKMGDAKTRYKTRSLSDSSSSTVKGKCEWTTDAARGLDRGIMLPIPVEMNKEFVFYEDLGSVNTYSNTKASTEFLPLVDPDSPSSNTTSLVNVDQCKLACNDHPMCAGYRYTSGSCKLTQGADLTRANGSSTSVIFKDAWIPLKTNNFVGRSYTTISGCNKQCAESRCLTDSKCQGFTIDVGSNTAYLAQKISKKAYGYVAPAYEVIYNGLGWNEARDFCRTQKNGHLAQVFNRQTRDAVYGKIAHGKAWIGVYRECNSAIDDCFRQSLGGTPLRRSYWGSGQPADGTEKCVYQTSTSWGVESCDIKNAFVCAVNSRNFKSYVKRKPWYKYWDRTVSSEANENVKSSSDGSDSCERLCQEDPECVAWEARSGLGLNFCYRIPDITITREDFGDKVQVKYGAADSIIYCARDQQYDNGVCRNANNNDRASLIEIFEAQATTRAQARMVLAKRGAVDDQKVGGAETNVKEAGSKVTGGVETKADGAGGTEEGLLKRRVASLASSEEDGFENVLAKKHGHSPHSHTPHTHSTASKPVWDFSKPQVPAGKSCTGDTSCSFEGDCDSCVICNEKKYQLEQANYMGEVAEKCYYVGGAYSTSGGYYGTGGLWDDPSYYSASNPSWWPKSFRYGNRHNRRCTCDPNHNDRCQEDKGRISFKQCKTACAKDTRCPAIINFVLGGDNTVHDAAVGQCYIMTGPCLSALAYNENHVYRMTSENNYCRRWCEELQSTTYAFSNNNYASAKMKCSNALTLPRHSQTSAHFQIFMNQYPQARQESLGLLNEWIDYREKVKEGTLGSCEATKNMCCATRTYRYMTDIHSSGSKIVEFVGSIDNRCEDLFEFMRSLKSYEAAFKKMHKMIKGLSYVNLPLKIFPATKKVAKIAGKMLKKAEPAFKKVFKALEKFRKVVGYEAKGTNRHTKIAWLCSKMITLTERITNKLNGYLDKFEEALEQLKDTSQYHKGRITGLGIDIVLMKAKVIVPDWKNNANFKDLRMMLALYRAKQILADAAAILTPFEDVVEQTELIELPDVDLSFATKLSDTLLKFPIKPIKGFLDIRIW